MLLELEYAFLAFFVLFIMALIGTGICYITVKIWKFLVKLVKGLINGN